MNIRPFLVTTIWILASLACQHVLAQVPVAVTQPETATATASTAAVTTPPTAASVGLAPSPVVTVAVAATQTTPAVAPLTRPGLVGAETLNGADTAWMMVATALVLLMTLPRIALFYGGMVRRKSVINTMACVVAVCALVSLLWFAAGYSIAFTPGSGALSPFIGGTDRLWFAGLDYIKNAQKVAVSHIAPNIPESVYAMYHLTFAIITAALVVGAFVERMRFSAMLIFMGLWSLVFGLWWSTRQLRTGSGSRVAGWHAWACWTLQGAQWFTLMLVLLAWCVPTLLARVKTTDRSPFHRSTLA